MSRFTRFTEISLPRSRHEAFDFGVQHGLLPKRPFCKTKCKGHGSKLESLSHYYRSENDVGIYRCPKSAKCRADITVAKNTWFENSHLSPEVEIRVLFGFAHDESYERIILGTKSSETQLSSATIAARMRYCREMVTNAFSQMQASLPKIGGPGIIVQIDESKFGKRKYNRGRVVEGHWVFGMIADNSEDLRMVICPDNKRDAGTLIPLVEQHIEKGSIIHSDMWKAYERLSEYDYQHHTVNHSVEFVAEGGTHTQRIESSWSAAKKFLKGQHIPPDEFADRLCEYLWRRHCKKNNLDPMDELINCIKLEYGHF